MSDYQALEYQIKDGQVIPKYVPKQFRVRKDGEVLIRVQYSSINHKDALALDNNSGVIKNYPIVPGIDFSGMIIESNDSRFFPGDKVVGTGFNFGVTEDGGYSEFVTTSSQNILKVPRPLTMRDAMIFGTAGVTAAIALSYFLQMPASIDKQVPILITGATGGVGGLLLAMLRKLKFTNVTAVTRQDTAQDYLKSLGAAHVIAPEVLTQATDHPLQTGRYMMAIDGIGGDLLGHILPYIKYGGKVVTYGNADKATFQANVLPFILRNISLIGVDSVFYPNNDRAELWQLLATALRPDHEHNVAVHEIGFEEMIPVLKDFLKKPKLGRTIVAFP
ncbi:YhdH/YhfP family quinone oxidoreductase [Agrilactobacillus fermenti]|uniref:YhdH/YhfP family quinone oxidoreductase n=1 Tax=Agrilactobacillus fermenti TaxID=2586909 RepID=UPI001E2910A9|nr:YhdH/YhfP family quinone oxidoreductase [Agrilactobacillus fermenti]MCD2256330.1 YhdH/YhfP family quinone oxidoreductase [Agrilactobacillus fermenti]